MMRANRMGLIVCLIAGLGTGCSLITDSSQFLSDGGPVDSGRIDGGRMDSGSPEDAGPIDGGPVDAGPTDGGPTDSGPLDAGSDAGTDAGPPDAGTDAGPPPPTVVLLSGVPEGTTTNTSQARFTYTASSSGTVTYECQLASVTSAGSTSTGFMSCGTEQDYELLSAGMHTFSVRARVDGGPPGPATTRSWNLEALPTSIRPIQEGRADGSFDENTLVSFTARVQRDISGFSGFPRLVVLQDAAAPSVTLGAWHAIFAVPGDGGEASFSPGRTVRVVGTVREESENTRIVAATFERMGMNSPYPPYQTRDATEVTTESMEAMTVTLSGGIPSSNCRFCNSGSGSDCFESCEGGCHPVSQRNRTGDARDYGDDGTYRGVMVDQTGRMGLWVFEFEEQNDACL